jgi:hypothetical protein
MSYAHRDLYFIGFAVLSAQLRTKNQSLTGQFVTNWWQIGKLTDI